MVSTSGWLKLYRQVIQSSVWTNSDWLKMWVLVLTQAAFTDNITQKVNGIKVKVNRGEWATNRRTAAQLFNYDCKPEQQISESTAYRILMQLKSDSMVNIKSTNKYSVVTVINYDAFQFGEQLSNSDAIETRQKSDNFLKNLRTKEVTTTTTENQNPNNQEQNPFEFFQKNGFGQISGFIGQDMNQWIGDFQQAGASETEANAIVVKSLQIAVERGKTNWGYAKAILKDWDQHKLHSIAAIDAEQAKHQQMRSSNNKPAPGFTQEREYTDDDLPF
ncbi:DnaD domain protein [Loigolactobacillus coryniformis]|uniref:DnaD domain-containing protein n=1 Tax=Loigolactobacillus coryniformis TaxID=1610 RepID=UPI002341A0CC|nr:DnaD domain protein [Loigolactobacillus coryniformis]MDC4184535.1 DnaD domain protein [Loigolactobacillus coryniformis]